ncbi:MAG: alpha/beta hydrolase [Pseudomonadales bacterium]|nr:alpha/beta hydrolase [Pseudomonadales bacterium]
MVDFHSRVTDITNRVIKGSQATGIIALSLLYLGLSACSIGPEFATQEEISQSFGRVIQDQKRLDEFVDENPNIIRDFQVGDATLHYVEVGDAGKPTVVLIHGTPGDWTQVGTMLLKPELQEVARLVSIDRPGWGQSRLVDQRTEPDFAAQSALIEPLLRQLKQESGGQPLILVGVSYGGSISPYLAYRNPELVDGLVMVSSAIDPVLGRPRWYNRAACVWPISRLIDTGMQKANDEIWGVATALREMEDWWQTVTIPMVYVQGEEDELVNPGNLDFAENMLPDEYARVVRIPGAGHVTWMIHTSLVVDLTLEVLKKAEENDARLAHTSSPSLFVVDAGGEDLRTD